MFIFRISEFLFDKRILIYFISIMLSVMYMVIDFDISILFFILLWIVIGDFIISKSFSKENIKTSKIIFSLTFFAYLGFMILTQMFYVKDPFFSYFYVPDQMAFYNRIFDYSQSSIYSGAGLFDLSNLSVLNHGTGLYYLGWAIGRISYTIGGSNSLVIHKLVVVWCVSMTNVFLYNTSRYFLDENKSKIITLTYAFFSYSLLFSVLLLRDLHVALLLAIGFYIILGSFKIKKLIILVLLAVITFTFRPTHAFYYLLMITFYLYIPLRKYKVLVALFSVIVLFIFVAFTLRSEFAENLVERSETYTEFHDEQAAGAGGAAKLYGVLPSFMHPPFRIIQSQINPFSLFRVSVIPKRYNNAGEYQYLSYTGSIADFLWFVIWIIIIYGMSRKYIRRTIPMKLFFAFLLAFVLLILAGFSSFDMRRLLGVYPIIYLSAMVILFNLTRIKRKRVVDIAVAVFLILGVVLYIIF